jgi:type IV pilus assembly protein PilA
MAKTISLKTGVALVLATVAVVALLIANRHVCGCSPMADEVSAVGSLRTLYSANIAYAKDHPADGYPKKLRDLSLGSEEPEQQNHPEWVIDHNLAGGAKSGYRFSYSSGSSKGNGTFDAYEIYADPSEPGKTAKRHFFVNETGVIRVSETGPANANDPVLQ